MFAQYCTFRWLHGYMASELCYMVKTTSVKTWSGFLMINQVFLGWWRGGDLKRLEERRAYKMNRAIGYLQLYSQKGTLDKIR